MTRELLAQHQFRIAGTAECGRAAHAIAQRFAESCDRCQEETFTLRPKALWCLGKVLAAIYVLSIILSIGGSGFVFVGCVLCMLGLAYGLSQYVFYWRIFDPIFRVGEGCNVVGTLEPTETVKRQILLIGHHDSPYIFSFLEHFQAVAFIRFLLGMVSYVWLCFYSVLLAVQQLRSAELVSAHGPLLWITVAGLPFAFQLFFMMSGKPSPGAGDNLNSTSMHVAVSKYFKEERNGDAPLKHTRLIILSTDGEEIGQRGAIEFARRHEQELHGTQSYAFNVDSVYYYKDLAILTRDRNSTVKLSDGMASDVREVAARNGIKLKAVPIPFGGGGSDAAAFAVAGLEATTVIAQPMGFICRDHLYHTSKDIVERIELDAVQAVIKLEIRYIRMVDDRSE